MTSTRTFVSRTIARKPAFVSTSAMRQEYIATLTRSMTSGVPAERWNENGEMNGTIRNGGAASFGKHKRMFDGGGCRIRLECETETFGRIAELLAAAVKSLLVTWTCIEMWYRRESRLFAIRQLCTHWTSEWISSTSTTKRIGVNDVLQHKQLRLRFI